MYLSFVLTKHPCLVEMENHFSPNILHRQTDTLLHFYQSEKYHHLRVHHFGFRPCKLHTSLHRTPYPKRINGNQIHLVNFLKKHLVLPAYLIVAVFEECSLPNQKRKHFHKYPLETQKAKYLLDLDCHFHKR